MHKCIKKQDDVIMYQTCVQLCIIYTTAADEADAYMSVFCFFVRHKNTRQLFSGTAERIFMKLTKR